MGDPPRPSSRPLLALACLGCCALGLCVGAGALIAVLTLRAKAPVRAVLTPRGGRVELGPVAIVAPEGAVSGDVSLSATTAPAPSSPDENLVVVSPAFHLDCGRRLFEKPVTVELPYDAASVPEGATPIPLLWTGRAFLPLEGKVDAARGRVVFEAEHFSPHAVGYKASPSKPAKKSERYPFDVVVVERYRASMRPELPAELESAIALAYARLTEPTWNYLYYTPPHGSERRLKIEVTDVTANTTTDAYAVTPSDDLIQVSYTLPNADRVRAVAAHEFFHAVQWAYYKRTCQRVKLPLDDEMHARMAWFDEASATWMAHQLLPNLRETSELATERFCYQPLLFHAGEAKRHSLPVEPGAERHEYASAIFIQYLVSKLGGKVVHEILAEAFAREDVTDSERVLEAVLRRASGKKSDALWSFYTDFVLAHEWSKSFGWDAAAWKMGKPNEVETIPDRVLDLTVEPTEPATVTLEAATDAYRVPRAIRVKLPPGAQGTLVLRLSGGTERERWFHAFSGPPSGPHHHVGGADTELRFPIEKGREVTVLPIARYGDALTLEAKIEPPPELQLIWVGDQDYFEEWVGVDFKLSARDPAKAHAKHGGPEAWVRLDVVIGGEKRYVYGKLGDMKGDRGWNFHDCIPVASPGPLELVASLKLGDDVVTSTPRTITRDPKELARTKAVLEKRLKEQSESPKRGPDVLDLRALGNLWYSLGEIEKARAAWNKMLEIDKPSTQNTEEVHERLARLALVAGDLEGYESHIRAASPYYKLSHADMAAAAVRVHDDLEKAWQLDARRSPDEKDPTILYPRRGEPRAR